MVLVLLVWTLIVAAVWWFADVALGFITPGSAWLAANPDLAGWIAPALGFLGTLGPAAAVIVWLAGVVLILLIGRGRSRHIAARRSLSYEEWQREDGGGMPPQRRRFRQRYDDDDDRPRRRRRRRDDDDDDDDDDD